MHKTNLKFYPRTNKSVIISSRKFLQNTQTTCHYTSNHITSPSMEPNTGVLISPQPDQEGNKLQRQKILIFIYPIYNHNWRNISTIFVYITRLARKEIFSPSNKINREVGRAKDLPTPLYIMHDMLQTLLVCNYSNRICLSAPSVTLPSNISFFSITLPSPLQGEFLFRPRYSLPLHCLFAPSVAHSSLDVTYSRRADSEQKCNMRGSLK